MAGVYWTVFADRIVREPEPKSPEDVIDAAMDDPAMRQQVIDNVMNTPFARAVFASEPKKGDK